MQEKGLRVSIPDGNWEQAAICNQFPNFKASNLYSSTSNGGKSLQDAVRKNPRTIFGETECFL